MERNQTHDQSGVPRRILVVDDEVKLCQVLVQYFAYKGYEVRAVQRGDEALALADAFHPHVVLLDLLMPGMDGIATLKALKQLTPSPRVLMVSVADHEEVAKGALNLGADFYLCKPINLAELEHLVNGFYPPQKSHHAS
ncbi:MAG: response regulator [Candidatus Omnitrophica bacterium]|nr:response regulator [Candidatus Omnitrophota bacterium]